MIKKIAHIAVAVNSLEEALKTYGQAFGLKAEHIEPRPEQGVKVAFVPVGESAIEFLEPSDPNGGVAKFIQRRGEGIHHICLEVDNIDQEIQNLSKKGTELIDKKARPGVEGMVAFIHPKSTQGVLVELVQKK